MNYLQGHALSLSVIISAAIVLPQQRCICLYNSAARFTQQTGLASSERCLGAWPLWKAWLCKLPRGRVRPAASPDSPASGLELFGFPRLSVTGSLYFLSEFFFLICENFSKLLPECNDELSFSPLRVRWESKSVTVVASAPGTKGSCLWIMNKALHSTQ